ncbi:MAG: putative bifunctional diguanylate cyclase/phosphodiesterase [Solirubrobacteraceae bacterium]|jgi:diguanylate cyclase (GGDEF)-like protein/PAS domain S-box-containing protein
MSITEDSGADRVTNSRVSPWDEERYASLVANVPGAVYRCAMTSDWDMEYMSPEIENVSGYPAAEFLGLEPIRTFASVIHADDRDGVEAEVERAVERREPFALDYRIIHADGEIRWVHERGRGIFGPDGAVAYLDGAIFDTTKRKRLEEQLEHLAYHDPLTGLPNRSMFRDHVEVAIARCGRYGGTLAVLFVDLDEFKLVNDSFGHSVGDVLLCDVAARLRNVARTTDVVARQGGDEFMVLIVGPPGATDESSATLGAARLADRLRETLAEPLPVSGIDVPLGASIGIALYPDHATTADDLMKRADVAMYQAKGAGGNSHRVYVGDDSGAIARLSLAGRLRGALQRDEFLLHYQPLVELESGKLVGAEALIRWCDPDRGLISPAEFIPLAERTGLIEPISDWVLAEACRQCAEWREGGLDLYTSVNLPARFWEPTAMGRVLDTIRSFGLNPSSVMIEITESAAMANPERNEATISKLRERGLRVAIDDFGTGHSSLSRLNQMLVSILKIDMSFVRDVPADPTAASLVAAIIQLAQSLGLTALAEGVETEAQRQFLVGAGCPLGQGYHFSRPVPAEQIPAYALQHA